MRNKHNIIFATLFVWLFSACNEKSSLQQKEFNLTNDWKQKDAFSITFSMPPDFIEKNKPNISGDIKFYENKNTWLVLSIQKDVQNTETFSKENDFHSEQTFVDKKPAEILTFTGKEMVNEAEDRNYVAFLKVSRIHNTEKSLVIWSYSKTQEDREVVRKIFTTVKFSQ